MRRTLRAALEHQEQGVRAGVRDDLGAEGGAEQHLQLHHVGPTRRVDGQSPQRRVPVPARRKWDGQPD